MSLRLIKSGRKFLFFEVKNNRKEKQGDGVLTLTGHRDFGEKRSGRRAGEKERSGGISV